MKVKSEREVAQLCLTLRDPMDCSPPGSSVHGTFQARVLEWVAIAFSEIKVQSHKYYEAIKNYAGFKLLKISNLIQSTSGYYMAPFQIKTHSNNQNKRSSFMEHAD